MKHVVANLLLKLAGRLDGGSEDGVRLRSEASAFAKATPDRTLDRMARRGSKIEDGRRQERSSSGEMADALFTARPLWGEDEARAVLVFLSSPAGQLFSRRIRSVAAHVAIEGANDRANTIHSAGVSAGWNECVRYIHSLSRVSGEQDTRQGAASHLKAEQGPHRGDATAPLGAPARAWPRAGPPAGEPPRTAPYRDRARDAAVR